MRYFDKATCLFLIFAFSNTCVFAQTGRNLALRLRGNVVHLQASFEEKPMQNGFGFVIGEKNDKLYIATATHVVIDGNSIEKNKPKELKVKFYQLMSTHQGEVLYYNSEKDVAIISVDKPEEYKWAKKCVDNYPNVDGKAYYIGKEEEWTIPTEAAVGGIKKIDDVEDRITAENLNIAPGSSGGPLLSKNGIIGVITKHEGDALAVGDPIAVGLKTIENIATNDGRYPYAYSLRPTKLPAKVFIISGVAIVGATGVILGIQQINEANDLYRHYKEYRNPESPDYPHEGFERDELYDEADKKYIAGQALVIGGSIALAGAAAWFIIKEQVIKPKKKAISNLSITPQFYWANGSNSTSAREIRIVYKF